MASPKVRCRCKDISLSKCYSNNHVLTRTANGLNDIALKSARLFQDCGVTGQFGHIHTIQYNSHLLIRYDAISTCAYSKLVSIFRMLVPKLHLSNYTVKNHYNITSPQSKTLSFRAEVSWRASTWMDHFNHHHTIYSIFVAPKQFSNS